MMLVLQVAGGVIVAVLALALVPEAISGIVEGLEGIQEAYRKGRRDADSR